MLPAADCTDTTPACNTINGMADALLDVCHDALGDCGCENFAYVVSVNEPNLGGDYLGVWLSRADPMPSSQPTGQLLLPRLRYTFSIKLHEEGFPKLDGDKRPSAKAVDAASRVSNARIEYVLRRVVDALRRDTMKLRGGFQSCGPLIVLPRDTGGVSWRFDVTVELAFEPLR